MPVRPGDGGRDVRIRIATRVRQGAWKRLSIAIGEHTGDAVSGAGPVRRGAVFDRDQEQIPLLVRNRVWQDVLVVNGAGGLGGVEGAQALEFVGAAVDDPGDVLLVVVEPWQVGGADADLAFRHDQLGNSAGGGRAGVGHVRHVQQDQLHRRRIGERRARQEGCA